MTKSRSTIRIPQDLLRSLYEKGMSTAELADYFNCCQDTICRHLRIMNIKLRARYQQLPTEEIAKRYQSGEAVRALAAEFHVSAHTIYKRLKEAQCPILYQSTKPRTARRTYKNLPTEEIIFLYQVSGLSSSEIAKFYEVEPHAITSRLKKAGIPLRGNSLHLPKHAIMSAYDQGVPLANIAKEYNTSYQVIRNLLIHNGCYQKSKTFKAHHDHIFHLYTEEHWSISEIASYYDCHRETIRRAIRKKEAELMSC